MGNNLNAAYNSTGLQEPLPGEFENDLEKQIYMAINVCRHSPKWFVQHVENVYKNNPRFTDGRKK